MAIATIKASEKIAFAAGIFGAEKKDAASGLPWIHGQGKSAEKSIKKTNYRYDILSSLIKLLVLCVR